MKIVLMHYAAPPVVGGVEIVIGHQARLLAGAGHEVMVVAGRGEQADDRVSFVRVPQADSRHPDVLAIQAELNLGRVPRDFSAMVDRLHRSLGEILQSADWLIAHNVCSLNKNLALTAALKRINDETPHPRLILWHHDLAWTTPRYRDELHDGYPWELLRTAWPQAVQVTVSEFRRRELAGLYGVPSNEIRVIPNGLDAGEFLKLGRLTEGFVQALKLMEAWPLLLLPVRITRRKNIELALRTLSHLRGQFPQAALLVTGPLGPHNPANREYFSDLLSLRAELGLTEVAHFLAEHTAEYLPDEVIADFYRLSDCLFMPSREEGFGIPILEAGLSGIPVFCANIPPLRELGDAYVDYFELDADPADIAAMMIRRISSSSTLGLRRRVRAGFTWDQIYRKHIDPLIHSGEN